MGFIKYRKSNHICNQMAFYQSADIETIGCMRWTSLPYAVLSLFLQNTIVQREIIDFSGGKGDNRVTTSSLDCLSAERVV
jgi:hypothetical protein